MQTAAVETGPAVLSRRDLAVVVASAATAAVLATAGEALADEVPADLLVGRVTGRPSGQTLQVAAVEDSRQFLVQTTANTRAYAADGQARDIAAIQRGESLVVVAPGAATADTGHVLTARRLVPCNLGQAADVQH